MLHEGLFHPPGNGGHDDRAHPPIHPTKYAILPTWGPCQGLNSRAALGQGSICTGHNTEDWCRYFAPESPSLDTLSLLSIFCKSFYLSLPRRLPFFFPPAKFSAASLCLSVSDSLLLIFVRSLDWSGSGCLALWPI